MIIRLFFIFTCALGFAGCRSPGPLDRALDAGPPGLERGCVGGLTTACALRGKSTTVSPTLPILQGLTSRDRARFTVVLARAIKPRYFVRDGESFREVRAVRVTGPGSEDVIDQLNVSELRPGADFDLIVGDRATGALIDRRVFRALDPDKARARLAVISATDETLATEAARMWALVLDQDADLLILAGNIVHVDHSTTGHDFTAPTAATLWRRNVEVRRNLPLFLSPRLVPTLATWDDHDFGYANADRTFGRREVSRETFLTFYDQASADSSFARGPGIASWWTGFGIELGLTDNRSFRSVDRAGGVQTHFGPEQENWLVARLAKAGHPVVMVSGDQFFGGYHGFASFEGAHPENFRAQLARWRQAATQPFVFLSANRRFSEVSKIGPDEIGFASFEITTGGLHARRAGDEFVLDPNPRRLTGMAGAFTFTIIEIMRAEPTLLRLGVQAFGPNAALLYQRTLAVKR